MLEPSYDLLGAAVVAGRENSTLMKCNEKIHTGLSCLPTTHTHSLSSIVANAFQNYLSGTQTLILVPIVTVTLTPALHSRLCNMYVY